MSKRRWWIAGIALCSCAACFLAFSCLRVRPEHSVMRLPVEHSLRSIALDNLSRPVLVQEAPSGPDVSRCAASSDGGAIVCYSEPQNLLIGAIRGTVKWSRLSEPADILIVNDFQEYYTIENNPDLPIIRRWSWSGHLISSRALPRRVKSASCDAEGGGLSLVYDDEERADLLSRSLKLLHTFKADAREQILCIYAERAILLVSTNTRDEGTSITIGTRSITGERRTLYRAEFSDVSHVSAAGADGGWVRMNALKRDTLGPFLGLTDAIVPLIYNMHSDELLRLSTSISPPFARAR
jgi:hypothetical protein